MCCHVVRAVVRWTERHFWKLLYLSSLISESTWATPRWDSDQCISIIRFLLRLRNRQRGNNRTTTRATPSACLCVREDFFNCFVLPPCWTTGVRDGFYAVFFAEGTSSWRCPRSWLWSHLSSGSSGSFGSSSGAEATVAAANEDEKRVEKDRK